MEFTFCGLSIDDLEVFRDEKGFIDLDAAGVVFDAESREKRGDTERIKNWVDFAGEKVLVKAERMLEGERNFGVYSELIVEELAKQMGLTSARYDLIKCGGKYGVLSHMMNDLEKEEFDTIYSLIGETEINPEYPDISDFAEVEEKFKDALEGMDMTSEEVEGVIAERRKQKILQLFVCEADGHIENEGVIRYKNADGRTVVRTAPMFDNEASFMLDMDEKTLMDAVNNNDSFNWCSNEVNRMLSEIEEGKGVKATVEGDIGYRLALQSLKDMAQTEEEVSQVLTGDAYLRRVSSGIASKVAFLQEQDDAEYGSITDNTLAYLRDISEDDEEIEEFMGKVFEELDIDAAIENVENRIKAPIPDLVKKVVRDFTRMRRKALDEILSYQLPGEERAEEAHLLAKLIKIDRAPQKSILDDFMSKFNFTGKKDMDDR